MHIRTEFSKGNIDEIIDYLKANLPILLMSELKDDPFILSLREGYIPVIDYLLKENYHLLCQRGKQTRFLECAASRNYHKVLIKLIREVSYSRVELTRALSYSTPACDVLTVKILLDAGATFNEKESTSLIEAMDHGNTEVATFLIHELTNIEMTDEMGYSLLHHISSISQYHEFLTYLLYRGLDVNQQDKNGRTPLMHTVSSVELEFDNLFMEFGKELLASGANPNMQDHDGYTSLMMTCMFKNYVVDDDDLVDYMKMLLDYGADVQMRNKKGKTALDIAKEYQFEEAVCFLDQYTSDLYIPGTDVMEHTNAEPSIHNYPITSFLSEKGYKTKLSRNKRWEILQNEIFPQHSPQIVINKLADFIRRFKAQRNGSTKYAEAIAEWEYDIERIREFY